MRNFWTLPVTVMGNASTNRMYCGILKCAILPRQYSRISSSVSAAPARRRTHTATASPSLESGTPTTCTSAIFGWVCRNSSISRGEMFSPPRMIMSLARPGDFDVAIGEHDRQVAGVEPAIRVDGAAGGFRVAVVALHHHVAARAELAGFAPGHAFRPSARRSLTSALGRAAPTVETRVSTGSSAFDIVISGRCLGLPVGDGDAGAVHFGHHALHHFDRARRAGHHAGAQRREIERARTPGVPARR